MVLFDFINIKSLAFLVSGCMTKNSEQRTFTGETKDELIVVTRQQNINVIQNKRKSETHLTTI